MEKTPPPKILKWYLLFPRNPAPYNARKKSLKIAVSSGFVAGFVAVSLANETSNETSTPKCKTERNLIFPVSRYKYYNPANGTRSVSFENRLLVGGFVRFRWTICFGFVRFVAGFVGFVRRWYVKIDAETLNSTLQIYRPICNNLWLKNLRVRARYSATLPQRFFGMTA